ncbi:MAG: hypothetical protein H0U10_17190, partial [Chloroflexia bacterium]|nr:hypothetical protein [Chloroflexia bacterium]
IARQTLGWSAERAAREVGAYREFITRYRPRSLDVGSTHESEAMAVTLFDQQAR